MIDRSIIRRLSVCHRQKPLSVNCLPLAALNLCTSITDAVVQGDYVWSLLALIRTLYNQQLIQIIQLSFSRLTVLLISESRRARKLAYEKGHDMTLRIDSE